LSSTAGALVLHQLRAKKGIQLSEHLRGEIHYPVPHWQRIFSFPNTLRLNFKSATAKISLCGCQLSLTKTM
jgi:hypothetical protein